MPAALRCRHGMNREDGAAFRKAYNYLRGRSKFMRYAAYERVGIPRGSGVTEAACKTIYTQRRKLSGMCWGKVGAQTVLDLRVLLLSEVFDSEPPFAPRGCIAQAWSVAEVLRVWTIVARQAQQPAPSISAAVAAS